MLRPYYLLIKPRIVYGNAIAAAAGFLLGSRNHFELTLFLAMLGGISLVVASACIFNNLIDQKIDGLMQRTSKRPLVQGTVSAKNALIYAIVLLVLGVFILSFYTNLLSAFLAISGFFLYVVVYSIAKRRSFLGTIIGSIPGSIPLTMGYCAATNRFDAAALLLIITLALWQIPHFYSLAIYRRDDYAKANLPVLPVVKGIRVAKKEILFYIVLFMIFSLGFSFLRYTGFIFFTVMIITSLIWLGIGLLKFKIKEDKVWGRLMFRLSLFTLLIFCAALSLSGILTLP